jgi:ferric-dicitrate binding protein FerR (iron transport regulator)
MASERSPSSEPSLSELAARELRRVEAGVPAREDGERAAHLALLGATVREERARAMRRRWTTGALALAAALIAAVGLRAVISSARAVSPPESTALSTPYDVRVEGAGADVVRGAAVPPAGGTDQLRTGDRVTSRSGVVSMVVATGSRLTLDQGAELSVVEAGRAQVFALQAGAIRADVAKLHEGERFLVRTSDTEVEVRGTSFRVERVDVAPPCRPDLHTRVIVSEGVVVVRHAGLEDRVRAGEHWPAACGPASQAPISPPPTAVTAPVPVAVAPVFTPPPSPSASPSSASSGSKLAASNDLFARAQAARKGGDPRKAVGLYEELLAGYPSSPVAESAAVERMRALDQFDRARSVVAAREYLARFPRGFARGEAEAIVALGP